jgi:transposase InsO family protein
VLFSKITQAFTGNSLLIIDGMPVRRVHPFPRRFASQNISSKPIMSRRGNCWDIAPMENFFGHLKEEYLRYFNQTTFKDTEQLIDEYIYYYNYERIQLKTRQTPYETRCLSS